MRSQAARAGNKRARDPSAEGNVMRVAGVDGCLATASRRLKTSHGQMCRDYVEQRQQQPPPSAPKGGGPGPAGDGHRQLVNGPTAAGKSPSRSGSGNGTGTGTANPLIQRQYR